MSKEETNETKANLDFIILLNVTQEADRLPQNIARNFFYSLISLMTGAQQ